MRLQERAEEKICSWHDLPKQVPSRVEKETALNLRGSQGLGGARSVLSELL